MYQGPLSLKSSEKSEEGTSQRKEPTDRESDSEGRIPLLENLILTLNDGIKKIDRANWDSLLTDKASPFVEYDWLYCMEESKVATAKSGWQPLHLTVAKEDTGELVAAMPLYVKYHSMGEFIFDNAWADAAYNYFGVNYYPKLLSASPMTPAAGERLLVRPDLDEKCRAALQQVMAQYLKQAVAQNGLSSAHVNFIVPQEEAALEKDQYMIRTSMQYHWVNSDPNNGGEKFKSFEDYLACFPSKRRIKIKRERKSVYEDQNVEMKTYHGDTIPDDMFPVIFRIYKSTIDKLYYGRQYLNEEFFLMLAKHFKRNLCFFVAVDKETGDVLGGTFNIVKAGRFYGRYWGGVGRFVKNLHFETCYYRAIEYCIEQGLDRMEPGAGGGDFKFMRGFDPAPTRSAHFIENKGLRLAVQRSLGEEEESFNEAAEYLNRQSSMKNPKAPQNLVGVEMRTASVPGYGRGSVGEKQDGEQGK
uniref:BioF2-like acetyltransferase domain-containing protein n=1 Tax=Heterosigma akashiwo TaxID=2829 RepID=A0A6V1WMU1_HETAK|eukprot:CAMPEP_0194713092 /NCGR_PEP_ID=MMETSP0296-20130528/5037_1 /TAXON_ID=39354 /ORGANISM="Heterosigma akashiwo, Strain CCMP2393" /LENGTH=471 /DNA_ID=CAMNT_0039611747 /DNA_START=98 /DNA_END=1513 /DNA_ORIENTATION=-